MFGIFQKAATETSDVASSSSEAGEQAKTGEWNGAIDCERRELPSQSYGTPKKAIKSLILVLEQFCVEHFLILFQF